MPNFANNPAKKTWINVNFFIDNPPISTDPQWIIYIDVIVNGVLNSTIKIDTTTETSALIYSLYNLYYQKMP